MLQRHRALGKLQVSVFFLVPILIPQSEPLLMGTLDILQDQQLHLPLMVPHIVLLPVNILRQEQTKGLLWLTSIASHAPLHSRLVQLIWQPTLHTAQLGCMHPESIALQPQALHLLEQVELLFPVAELTSLG